MFFNVKKKKEKEKLSDFAWFNCNNVLVKTRGQVFTSTAWPIPKSNVTFFWKEFPVTCISSGR